MNPGYLPGLQIPLLTGRNIGPEDDATHPHVVLVNEALAKRYFGSPAKALGKHIDEDHQTDRPVYDSEIVGVVANYKLTGIRDAVEPTVFRPLRQASPKQMPNQLYFFVRTALSPTQTIETIRRTMRQIDPALALDNLRTMDEQIDDSLANDRLIELLALTFGGLASLLAGVGLYGVLAYSTAQRTREIGIRMALGSTRAAISRIVLADVLRLAGLGILVALSVAFGLSHLLRSQLFGVSPADPLSILFAVLLISAVAFIAALIPAVRAASINPTEALRTE
jgi:predicted permease